jgi:tRNA dimethylallyltransferase
MAVRLDPADTQRLVRALEVFEATGRSLADWQREPGVALIDADGAVRLAVYPDRAALNARIAVRFHAMIEAGALEEVEALVSHGIDGGMPAMRALGVGRLGAHLAGRCSLAEAADGAIADTRRYAKRQLTWMRRHMMSWKSIFAQQIETKTIDELAFIYRN